MKKLQSQYVLAPPTRRPLKIFASDPMLGRSAGNRVTIEVPNERLSPGPQGSRIEVIDYDGGSKVFYPPVNLDDPAILIQGGLEPTESDPRFHQQMVYAVATKTLENFERALGRRINLRSRGRGGGSADYARLRIFPHAFHGANAYYDPKLHALLFGYFRADRKEPGPNLPGQNVYTCLSHDIIAHEMTHVLVDRLRRLFLEPSNVDVLAFHEGFSDIVALFQHFSFKDLLREQIQRTRTDIRERTLLVELARQYGYATGAGRSLRSALDEAPNPRRYQTVTEPHARGSILVAAVFDAFFATYQRRIRDLLRIATGGSGTLPEGDLHPDLVARVSNEAAHTAQQILTMCIRAFDYLPPVDVTFGDYLRALVTADYELVPNDEFGLRGAMIEAFRQRGIYPEQVPSLAEESLLWDNPGGLPRLPTGMLGQLIVGAAAFGRVSASPSEEESAEYSDSDELGSIEVSKEMAARLHEYASEHAAQLHLDPDRKIAVLGFHSVFRVAPDGQLLIELVAQFAQQDGAKDARLGGLPFRGGTTVVAAADGQVRYVIAKPLASARVAAQQRRQAELRLERQREFVELCDLVDAGLPYRAGAEFASRMRSRMNLALLHQGAF